MKHRHQRGPLPARRDIGSPKIECDRQSETPRERVAVADLHREPALGPMQHGLAVKADDIDRAQRQFVVFEVICNGIAVRAGHQGLCLSEYTGPLRPVGHSSRVAQPLAQQRTLALRVGTIASRPECTDSFAVGLDHRHVNAVERCPAHQPDRLHVPLLLG
jgi:hypothetical protein